MDWPAALSLFIVPSTTTAARAEGTPSVVAVESDAAVGSEVPVDVELVVDLPVIASAAALGGGLFMLRDELVRERCAPHCDRSRVPAFEREFAGPYAPAAHAASNILVSTNLVLPHLFGVIDRFAHDHGSWRDFGVDAVLIGQALGISVGIHQLSSFVAQRPRPFAYSSRIDREQMAGPDAYLSFYSGHTANAFAVSTAYSYLFTLRHPGSRWVVPVWLVTHGLAALQGYTRVAAGYHYPSDVVVGAIAGSSIGILVPHLHRVGAPALSAVPLPSGGLGVGWSTSW